MKPARPTTALKQKKVLRNLGENGGSLRKAIKDAGYSQKYADNPKRLLGTRTWQELMKEMLPDALLATVHRALLVNEATAIKALDLAYKIKGKFKEDEKTQSTEIKAIYIVNPNGDEIPYNKAAEKALCGTQEKKSDEEQLQNTTDNDTKKTATPKFKEVITVTSNGEKINSYKTKFDTPVITGMRIVHEERKKEKEEKTGEEQLRELFNHHFPQG